MKDTFVHFAVDNSDFKEDTPDGKGTTHRTIVAVYQEKNDVGESVCKPLIIEKSNSLSLKQHEVRMYDCNKPNVKLATKAESMANFSVNDDLGFPSVKNNDWLTVSAVSEILDGVVLTLC